MTNSDRRRNTEIRRSKLVSARFIAIADRIQSLLDGQYADDIDLDEFQILQNQVALFRDLAHAREGAR